MVCQLEGEIEQENVMNQNKAAVPLFFETEKIVSGTVMC